jgi:hypothetical protein
MRILVGQKTICVYTDVRMISIKSRAYFLLSCLINNILFGSFLHFQSA